ncbi:hypothetical protein [Empedobacter sp.]|uniref:hypothetical protein n=1 Tax=Empedobacter sp. TaxID=1927715 RepID=UPI00289E5C83|nr:hypothetical protein [Empedobacter sp.]
MEVQLKQAEVVLKKTKITKSILSQTRWIPYKNLVGYTILGWCYIGNQKVVVSYNSETNILVKSDYYYNIEDFEITEDNVESIMRNMNHDYYDDPEFQKDFIGQFIIKSLWYDVKTIERSQLLFDKLDEKDLYVDILRRYMKKVIEIDQFFI